DPGLPLEYSFTANSTYNIVKDEIVFANHYEDMFIISASDLKILNKSPLPWKDIYDFDDGYISTEYDKNEYWLGAGHGKRIARYDILDYRFKGYLNIDYNKILGAYLRWYRKDDNSIILLSELGIYKLTKNNANDSYSIEQRRIYPSFFHEIYPAKNNGLIFFSNFLLNRVDVVRFDNPLKIFSYYTNKGPRWIVFDDSSGLLYVSNYSEGNVSVIDLRRNIILKNIMVGPRPRGIGKDPITGIIMVVSGCGVFRIDLTDECMKAKWDE
ncbi:MAG: hypothetical protein N3B13_11865, partial [Deltaproteobacteria bacterium]|nr:hypothetical protein [Deltaproteobacteria bacterium]